MDKKQGVAMTFKKVTRKRLGEILIDGGIITKAQLEEALARHKETKKLLGETLVELGFVNEEDVAGVVAAQYRIPYLPLKQHEVDRELLNLIPREVALTYRCFPVDKMGGVLTVAMENPLDEKAIGELESKTQCKVLCYVSTQSEILEAIEEHYGRLRREGAGAAARKDGGEIKVFQLESNGLSEE
jgi:type IV pilus assembly protein PilB